MHTRLRKTIALSLSIFYFVAQVALGSTVESNFWAERRRSISSQETKNQSPQFAALPSTLNGQSFNSKAFLNQLPSISATLPTAPKWSDSNKKKSLRISSGLKGLVDSIPLIYGSIQDVYDSGNDKNPSIVLLQDIHLNSEAQTNIAAVLQELIDQKQIGAVGVEGAFGNFDFSSFREFPDKKLIKKVAETFLNKNLIAAPSFVGVTSPGQLPTFVGVDDMSHYGANVQAYLSSIDSKEKTTEKIRKIKLDLTQQKQKIFSPELKRFDDLRVAHHRGDVGFGIYVKKLAALASENDFAVDQFLAAFDMETSLDFKKVDDERRRVIEKLTKVLNEKEISDLVAQSLAYRMGRLSFGVYYQGLKDLCAQHGIALYKTPAFDSYIRYVLLSDGIRPDKLFASIKSLEEKILNNLAQTDQEKDLAALSEHISLTEKLIEFSLTPIEWDNYRLTSNANFKSLRNDLAGLQLGPYEAFYKEADIRSGKMVERLLASDLPVNKVLVIGGFHTPEIAEFLKKQNHSFVVVSPKITKVDDTSGSSYLSIFAQEKSSLDRLFSGQKLFLSPAMVAGIGTGMPVAKDRSDFLLATEAATAAAENQGNPGVPAYKVTPGSNGFVRVQRPDKNLDLEVNPQTLEKRSPPGGFKPASFLDRYAKKIFAGKPGWYKAYTGWLTPLWETPVFGLVVMGLKATFGLTVTSTLSFTWPAIFLILGAAVVITVIHAALNRDWSPGALTNWFIGSLILVAPFAFRPFFQGALLSLVLHIIWNHVPFLRPMALLGFRAQQIVQELKDLLASNRGLVFTDDADVIDAQLFEEAKQTGQSYLRVRLKDQTDLDRLTTTVRAQNGDLTTKEGRLIEIVKGGGILFIDYNGSDPKLVEGFNSLFDPLPYYGSHKASPKLKVVGAISSRHLKTYPVSFYSRFRKIVSMRLQLENVVDAVRAPPSGIQSVEVELFESPLIRQTLIGNYYLDEEGHVKFEKGALVKAVETGKPLVIRGGNWNDPQLLDFLRQIIVKEEIEVNGETLTLPLDFQIYRVSGDYEKREIKNKRIVLSGEIKSDENVWVVNRENQDVLLSRTEITADGKLVQRPGLLDQPRLRLRVTDTVSDWVWHRILHSNANIDIEVVPGVQVPPAYRQHRSEDLKKTVPVQKFESLESAKSRKSFVVQSDDLGLALTEIKSEFKGQPVAVLHVTPETKLDQWISSIEIETRDNKRVFRSERQTLIEALRQGKVVIIEGADANPALFRQLESALHENPYLVDNNQRVDLSDLPGKLIVTCQPHAETSSIGSTRVSLKADDSRIGKILAEEFKGRFKEEDYKKILELRRIFETINRSKIPHLYPDRANFHLDRLRLLFQFNNWLEAFENVFISDYAEDPEVAAFMRTMVRVTFGVEEPGFQPGTIAENKLNRVLNRLIPTVREHDFVWQLADCLSLDLLKKLTLPQSFGSSGLQAVVDLVERALVKNASGNRERYYRDRFDLKATDVWDAPPIDRSTRVGDSTWQERKERAVRILKKFNVAFLKGSPGTGKSFITSQLAQELGYANGEIEGPVTVGADITEGDIVGRSVFDGDRTRRIDEAVARWAKRPRGLLVVDEANLTNPHFWNLLKGLIDQNHQVIFTGNQEFLAGRNFQNLFREQVVTVHFPEFDDAFLRSRIEEYVISRKHRRAALVDLLFSLNDLFRKMGRDKGFSLRDVQELVARVNTLCSVDWTVDQVALTAWVQFQGIFTPEERLALKHLLMRKFGVDIAKLEKAQIGRIKKDKDDFYRGRGVVLVDSAARTVRSINDFLAMREARLQGESLIQGKRGVIFEGPSGRGKDVLLIQTLQEHGFKDAKEAGPEVPATQKYYHLNASLNYDEMVRVIRQAQKEGSIVIVSEMNLLPSALLEGKLNDVLTGNAREGFAFFATINSTEFGGRETFSTALQNRVVYDKESDYSEAELLEIAQNRPGSLAPQDLNYLVKAHVWIRDQIDDLRYHPTTRDLQHAVEECQTRNGRTLEQVVADVYGPIFLTHVLGGRRLPSQTELLAYAEKVRVNNIEVLKHMGNALLPIGGKPFTIKIDASDPTQAGGYLSPSDNSVTLRAAAFQTNRWQDVFWHEVSHGLFTRDFDGLNPLGKQDPFDPLYQDLEDVRHTSAFDYHFPSTGLSVPSQNEISISHIISSLDTDVLLSWMRRSQKRLTPRHLSQYAITAYAKGLMTREQLAAMADVLDGLFDVNPLAMALRHCERALEIAKCIPTTMQEDEVRYQQHRALVLMNEMREDYLRISDYEEETPEQPDEQEQEHKVAEALGNLKATELNPTQATKVAAFAMTKKAPASQDVARKKQALEEQRRAAQKKSREDVSRELEIMEKDLDSVRGISLARLEEIEAQLTNPAHPFTLRNKLDQLKDPVLIKKADQLAQRVQGRIDQINRITKETAENAEKRQPGRLEKFLSYLFYPFDLLMNFSARLFGYREPTDEEIEESLRLLLQSGGGLGEGVGFGPVSSRYPSTRAHSRADRKNPKSVDDRNHRVYLQEWHSSNGVINDPRLDAVSTSYRGDLDRALEDFVVRRLQAQKIYGREGMLEVARFIQDPINGFVRSGGREERIKKQIIVRGHERPNTLQTAILDFLAESGFRVLTDFSGIGDIPDEQLKKIGKQGAVEVVDVRALQKKVEAIYLYGAFRSVIDQSKSAKGQHGSLSLDEQLRLAKTLVLDADVPEYIRNYAVRIDDEFGLIVALGDSKIRDLTGVGKLTECGLLNLSDTAVEDLRPLKNLKKLKRLFVNGTQIHDLTPLLDMTNLEDVTLDLNHVTIEQICEILRTHPNKSNLKFWVSMKDRPMLSVADLPEDFRRTHSLSTPTKTWGASEEAFQRQVRLVQSLKGNDQNMTVVVTEEGLRLTLRLKEPSASDLDSARKLTVVVSMAIEKANIKDLSCLKENKLLDDITVSETPIEDLEALLELPRLKSLSIWGSKVTLDQVRSFLARHPNGNRLVINIDGKVVRKEEASAKTGPMNLEEQIEYARNLIQRFGGEPNFPPDSDDPFEMDRSKARESSKHPGTLALNLNGLLSSFVNLELLEPLTVLSGLYLDGSGVHDLERLPSLPIRRLSIGRTNITDLTPLIKLKDLSYLTVDSTHVTHEQVYELLLAHPNDKLTIHYGTGSPEYTRSNIPEDYLARRNVASTELSFEEQVSLVKKLCIEAGVPERELNYAVIVNRGKIELDFNWESGDFDGRNVNIDVFKAQLLTAVSHIRFHARYDADLSPLLQCTQLERVMFSRPPDPRESSTINVDRIYWLLLNHPNGANLVIGYYDSAKKYRDFRNLGRGDIPEAFQHATSPPIVDQLRHAAEAMAVAQVPLDKQIKTVQGFLRKVGTSQEVREVDGQAYNDKDIERRLGINYTHYPASLAVSRKRNLIYITNLPEQLRSLLGLENIRSLHAITIHSTQINDLNPLRGLTVLEEIEASHTPIENLSPLSGISSLRVLKIDHTKVSDLSALKGLKNLRELNVSDTLVSDLTPLHGLPLEILDVPDGISQQQIDDLVRAHPNPEKLRTSTWRFLGRELMEKKLTPKNKGQTVSANQSHVFLKRLLDELVNRARTLEQVRQRFAEDGQLEAFEKLFATVEDPRIKELDDKLEKAAKAISEKMESDPIKFDPDTGSFVRREQQIGDYRITSNNSSAPIPADANIEQMAESLVDLALADNQLDKQRTTSSNLVGDLLALSPEHEVHVQDLTGSNRHVAFGLLMTNPRLDESEFFTVLERVVTERIKKKRLSIDQVADLLQQLAIMGLPQQSLNQIVETVLDTVKQVVVVVNGPEDEKKVKAVLKLVGDRRPVMVIRATEAMDREGRLVLSMVNRYLKQRLGRGLEDTLLVLPQDMRFTADIPEEILRALIIATINDLLQGRLLTGPALINIDKVARIIAQNA